ncbi:tryptophan synthase beta subunit-like PLP-dependent enzyme, partial [Tilletiaria anomala UBC 951]
LYIRTPLVYSAPLSQKSGHNIFLKLEALQPSGSFKFRGISRVIQTQASRSSSTTPIHVISSSGGNAGLAAATAARALGLSCTVFVPVSTEDYIVELLKAEGAEVVQGGAAWDICDDGARRKAAEVETVTPGGSVYVHPFEGEDLIRGHSTMVPEIYEQLKGMEEASGDAKAPDLLVCSVGGGGLLAGVLTGIVEQDTASRPHVVAVECFGADSFAAAHNSGKHIALLAITSKATSMGALKASAKSLALARSYTTAEAGGAFSTLTVPDSAAAFAGWQFARDHRFIVELACAASLTPAYFSEQVLPALLAKQPNTQRKSNIVIVVCGGSKVNAADIEQWRRE